MTASARLLLPLALAVAITGCSQPTSVATEDDTTAPTVSTPADEVAVEEHALGEVIHPASGTYTLDPAHTVVLAQWNHMGYSNPSAHFGNVTGTLVYDDADVSKSSVQVTLPLSGLSGFSDKFDEHLRGVDFFDAAKFPVASFKSTRVVSTGINTLDVTGDLTIKDITHPVTLAVILNGAGEHPMSKAPSIGFDATARIKRSDFGVGAYAPKVSDEVNLHITTEASIAKAP
ncbi:YceI family protein [Stenotrophomonas sp. YIM B06876]|uniref:YceI family protein n=1 Tax=Stenotrophomonas sp. YIM B06876 TaxID=3060211 RepID=UPI002739F992|nr:YceI family protein [Stenotrophomonas sp. YIM B06876]